MQILYYFFSSYVILLLLMYVCVSLLHSLLRCIMQIQIYTLRNFSTGLLLHAYRALVIVRGIYLYYTLMPRRSPWLRQFRSWCSMLQRQLLVTFPALKKLGKKKELQLFLLFALGFLVVVLRIFYLQIVSASYYD